MRAEVTLQHMSPIVQAPQEITRERAAYLIRAARSRRRHNVTTVAAHAYTLDDCSHLIVVKHIGTTQYSCALNMAVGLMEIGVEPRSALKQAGDDAGIPFGKPMEAFVTWAEAQLAA